MPEHVDFRLLGGLFTVFVVTVVRHFVEPKIAFSLAGVSPEVHFSALITILTIAAMILIYQQFTVLFFATVFSSVTVVALTIFGNEGIKKLSLNLMPEGQRFAEYAGFTSEQTSELMEKAKHFKKKDGLSTWKKALNAIGFLTSEEEKQTLSRDFSAGIEVYKQRKAFMDSMTDEELAEYRKAMAQFLDEKGLSENRDSLSNLKNAKP